MKNTFTANMFDSIKTALENAKNKNNAKYKNILSIAQAGTYIVRLLPNIKDPQKTFLHYYTHGWKSLATGQFNSIVSPSTWGERCPISELFFKITRNPESTETEKKQAKDLLSRKENWYVNVYVVNDPVNPENNGTVKVLRFGRQLNKIIESAISGDDAEEFGPKIFDLSPAGCNLRIKAELVSDKPGAPKYPTYVASKFLSPSAIEGLTDAKIEEIYNSVYDLSELVEHKTNAEIQEFIDVHFYAKDVENKKTEEKAPVEEEEEEDVPYVPVAAAAVKETSASKKTTEKTQAVAPQTNDQRIKDILDDLDDIKQ
jgi:hypothetical protein